MKGWYLVTMLTVLVGTLSWQALRSLLDVNEVDSFPEESLVPHSRRKRFVPKLGGKHGLSWDEIEMIILMHNNYRGIVSPPADNMRFLVSKTGIFFTLVYLR